MQSLSCYMHSEKLERSNLLGGRGKMIYSFHHFYEWLRGGVESGMAYRAKIFRSLGMDAKFVFATTFPNDNIQHETEQLGFLDSEVDHLYNIYKQNITRLRKK